MKYKLPLLLLFLTLITGYVCGAEHGTAAWTANFHPNNPQTTAISGRVTAAITEHAHEIGAGTFGSIDDAT
jgi:hypothetical protein